MPAAARRCRCARSPACRSCSPPPVRSSRTSTSSTPTGWQSRILGMGDVLTLIEQAEQVFDAQKAEEAAAKIGSGELTLEDFLEQMLAIRKMGPDRQPAGHAARRRPDEGRAGRRRRQPAGPPAGDHPGHDTRRAGRPQDHQRLAAAAHRQRLRCRRLRGQSARRPVLRGPQDDVVDGRQVRHARCRAARPVNRKGGKNAKGKKGKKGGNRGRRRRRCAILAGRRYARRLPRPVADAAGPRRIAARAWPTSTCPS